MLVLLFSFIYLIGHFGTYYIFSKMNLEDGPSTVTYTVAYYITLFISPIFIILISLLVTEIVSIGSLVVVAEFSAGSLALVLACSISVMVISFKKTKKTPKINLNNT